MTNSFSILTEVVLECAVDAVAQGLTSSYLTEGWELGRENEEWIEDQMERHLTADEWSFAKDTFAAFVRENS